MPTLASCGLHPGLVAKLEAANIFNPLHLLVRDSSNLAQVLNFSIAQVETLKAHVSQASHTACHGGSRHALSVEKIVLWVEEHVAPASSSSQPAPNKRLRPLPLLPGSTSALTMLLSESALMSPPLRSSLPTFFPLLTGNASFDVLLSSSYSSFSSSASFIADGFWSSPPPPPPQPSSSSSSSDSLPPPSSAATPPPSNGLLYGCVTEVVGPHGSGKSQLSLSVVARAVLQAESSSFSSSSSSSPPAFSALYFTSGGSASPASLARRLSDLCDSLSPSLPKRRKAVCLSLVRFVPCPTVPVFLTSLLSLTSLGSPDPPSVRASPPLLLVLDCISGLLSGSVSGGTSFKDDDYSALCSLVDCGHLLRQVAVDARAAVLVLNTPVGGTTFGGWGGGEGGGERRRAGGGRERTTTTQPALGKAWLQAADVRVYLEREGEEDETTGERNGSRTAEIVRHKYGAAGSKTTFSITQGGIA